MILSISEFCQLVQIDLNGLIDQVVNDVTGRPTTDAEKVAMSNSYPAVAQMLGKAVSINSRLAGVHISTNDLLLEYRLPAAPAWCDLVLLGKGYASKQVVIIELKDWVANTTDEPGAYEGYILHQGTPRHHPSDQVKGYVEYCQNFHSSVIEQDAKVSGCVFFTKDIDKTPYTSVPNHNLTQTYQVFNTADLDYLASYVCDNIEEPDESWATAFVNGYYKQNRNILQQVSEALRNKSAGIRPFVLLDGQRLGFQEVMSVLTKASASDQKEVIIVEGPPGSGKSAVAVNLWVEAVQTFNKNEEPGNIVFVTTSSSQKDNWREVFLKSEFGGADGFIMPANAFNPGMTGTTMKTVYLPVFKRKDAAKYLRSESSLNYEYYKEYTDFMIHKGQAKNYHDNHHFLSIVDEAHALINPLAEGFNTNKLGGWCLQMGPQAYHIIRQSRVSVFFMDGKQSFRDNETTSVDDIKNLAQELNAHVTLVSLNAMQFRCAGSVDYVDWVDHLFSQKPLNNRPRWKDLFDFNVVDNTTEMESYLREKEKNHQVIRLLSSYTVKWVSKDKLDAMHSQPVPFDFDFVNENGERFQRYWNNPSGYEIFVQARKGSLMATDPLCEVGCPYVVRGFDFDYIGVLWLDDILWRDGKWVVNYDRAEETANNCSRGSAQKELEKYRVRKGIKRSEAKKMRMAPLFDENTPMANVFANNLILSYRILLTRAVKGVSLYIRDKETREHVRQLLNA